MKLVRAMAFAPDHWRWGPTQYIPEGRGPNFVNELMAGWLRQPDAWVRFEYDNGQAVTVRRKGAR